MCGIAGIVALQRGRFVDPAPMDGMLACLRHRGPDDEGIHVGGGAVLGHRRLSVIDVEGGHQPLSGRVASTLGVVNGEIYNYRELARELASHGSRFRTASDSEVAVHAWEQWGNACLDRFDGMFALAMWNATEHRLLLARDRMGEKPLFYAVADDLLIFASELGGVLAHPAITRSVDVTALGRYLALDYVPAPYSLVAGVKKLEPGTALTMEQGVVRLERYWRITPQSAQPAPEYEEAVGQLGTRLDEAVRSRLVSDVPLGVFLSGGIDSSTIAALAARYGALDTFSIGFDEKSFDESEHARVVARHIGSRHHERFVHAHEMPDLVPGLADILDEPIGDASILPTTVLSRFAREHVTVALGGDGGDELFAGYPMHQAHRIAPLFRALPRLFSGGIQRLADMLPVSHRNFAFGFKVTTFMRGAALPAPWNHAAWMASFPAAELAGVLSREVRAQITDADPYDVFVRRWAEAEGAAPLARATYLDAATYLPNDILVKVDRASMSTGLEVRAPFLARNVVEYAFALPDSYRMKHLRGKRILRDVARDLLPSAILHRPKKGFGMPVAAWLTGSLRDLTHDLLSADSVRAAGYFDPRAVSRLLEQHDRRIRDHRKPIWTLLVFEIWRRAHMAPPVRRPARTRAGESKPPLQ